MADIGASNWNATDASNTTAAPDGAPEGMAPAGVNDVLRAHQGAIKRFWNRINPTATSAGSSTVYTLTYSPAAAALVGGELFAFNVDETCGSAPTLNINSLGAKNLRKFTAGAWANLAASDILANQTVIVRYNSSDDKYDVVLATGILTDYVKPADLTNQSTTGPTVQSFTSGSSATYTTPAGVKWIRVRQVGAGGGGGGTGGSTAPNGATGGTTTFNTTTAIGGNGGTGGTSAATGSGGTGGTGGSGTAVRFNGGTGAAAPGTLSVTLAGTGGMGGGSAFFGGAGAPPHGNATGGAGATNTGGGGSGASGSASFSIGGAGGGGGECAEFIIINPSATYTYTVGAGGAGGIGTGSGAATGGAGAAGFITVDEHYTY